MKADIFEFEVFGVPYIKFRNLNPSEDFKLIVNIIENKIRVDILKKFYGINSIIITYKKNDLEFELKMDEDFIITLTPRITLNQTQDNKNIESLRTIANEIVDYFNLINTKT